MPGFGGLIALLCHNLIAHTRRLATKDNTVNRLNISIGFIVIDSYEVARSFRTFHKFNREKSDFVHTNLSMKILYPLPWTSPKQSETAEC